MKGRRCSPSASCISRAPPSTRTRMNSARKPSARPKQGAPDAADVFELIHASIRAIIGDAAQRRVTAFPDRDGGRASATSSMVWAQFVIRGPTGQSGSRAPGATSKFLVRTATKYTRRRVGRCRAANRRLRGAGRATTSQVSAAAPPPRKSHPSNGGYRQIPRRTWRLHAKPRRKRRPAKVTSPPS